MHHWADSVPIGSGIAFKQGLLGRLRLRRLCRLRVSAVVVCSLVAQSPVAVRVLKLHLLDVSCSGYKVKKKAGNNI